VKVNRTKPHNNQPQENPFAAQQHRLVERLRLLLEMLHPVLRADVISALTAGGKLLSLSVEAANHPSRPAGSWGLLTLLVAEYISPDIDPLCASSVAIAVECFVCALDLLDDVEDEDQSPTVQALGIARTLNVSTVLLALAPQALLSLTQQGFAPTRVLTLLETLQEAALTATAGQHRDLLAEQRAATDLTDEECIAIAAGKAGSLMRLACRMGVLCAGGDDFFSEKFSALGEHLGIAHQLDNDSHDMYYLLQDQLSISIFADVTNVNASAKSGKTDLIRGKKTLPIVIAATKYPKLQEAASITDEYTEEYVQALREGIIATWGVSLLYRELAHDCMREMEARQPFDPLLRLLLGFQ
jgi:geranylgeranyl pyrophosphate synthase